VSLMHILGIMLLGLPPFIIGVLQARLQRFKKDGEVSATNGLWQFRSSLYTSDGQRLLRSLRLVVAATVPWWIAMLLVLRLLRNT
jgi:hypothetical protein